MGALPILTLKPGREIHVKNRHHAIFRNAVDRFPEVDDGGIVEVRGADGVFLCYAMFNAGAYICARAIAFEEGDPLAQLRRNIEGALEVRHAFLAKEETNACRLINAEGDGIPGLIVDRYADVLVMQLTTLGMDRLCDWVTDVLWDLCEPRGIYEKSTGPGRKKEGLEQREGWVRGGGDTSFSVNERGVTYLIDLAGGQKTGLFLDQREMRSLVRSIADCRTVLDCCSYVGGFALAALAGGAFAADAVDYDGAALAHAKENARRNGIPEERFATYAEDVFNFLRRDPPRGYDFIILDPPAFAKRSSDLESAKKAYIDLNRMAMQRLPAGGLLLTCSCSYQVDAPLFQQIVFHAARQARRSARILQRHRQAFDHPVNIYHPETDYLKSLLLWVE
ncbi:MAG: 23S rRNA (cytosine1962-C5)-methyltransferase [Candidatus Peregrinibacteria bacterium Gr01-1014_25]|nr:MAG: 23S rRNA (cytosine1962-C5)-methyltransferase [Candidatus Peregrinibacteria bacterium Gr01-1014_25]